MYGSDTYYEKQLHVYKPCTCFNVEPHCWYCGKEATDQVHVIPHED